MEAGIAREYTGHSVFIAALQCSPAGLTQHCRHLLQVPTRVNVGRGCVSNVQCHVRLCVVTGASSCWMSNQQHIQIKVK